MTADERNIMRQHVTYWTNVTEAGICVLFGPVSDPNGGYGIAVVEAQDMAAVDALIADDPAYKAAIMTYEVNPMKVGMIRQ
jgi:uncharacterized protein YciI